MRVLIHCPEADIQPFYAPMALIAHSLKARGHKVFMSSCSGSFGRCIPKLATPLSLSPSDNAAICGRCRSQTPPFVSALDLNLIPLESFMEPDLDASITALIEAWPGNKWDFEFDGQKLGRCAQFDLFLGHKAYEGAPITEAGQTFFLEVLHTVVKTYAVTKRLIAGLSIERVVVYNQYGPNMAVALAAKACGAEARFMANSSHAGVDRSVVWFTQWGPCQFYKDISADWVSWSKVALKPDMVGLVAEDIKFRFLSGSVHVYSPGKAFDVPDIRDSIGLRKDRRTIVVYTSSPDELHAQYAADEALGLSLARPVLAFPDQIAWFEDLKRTAANRQDLQICVRVHPREGPNRRDNIRSQHLALLEQVFGDLPDNMKVVWPEDKVSSYDLLECADLVMTGWSTMGLESARFGIPVLSVFQSVVGCPVGDFIKVPGSAEEYYALLDAMLGAPADLGNIRQAFRWYYVSKFTAAVSVGDAFPRGENQIIGKLLDNIETIERIIEIREPEERRRLSNWLAEGSGESDWLTEQALVKTELVRIILYFMTGQWREDDVDLRFGPGGGPLDGNQATLEAADGWCELQLGADRYRKMSRMVERLGRLLAS